MNVFWASHSLRVRLFRWFGSAACGPTVRAEAGEGKSRAAAAAPQNHFSLGSVCLRRENVTRRGGFISAPALCRSHSLLTRSIAAIKVTQSKHLESSAVPPTSPPTPTQTFCCCCCCCFFVFQFIGNRCSDSQTRSRSHSERRFPPLEPSAVAAEGCCFNASIQPVMNVFILRY